MKNHIDIDALEKLVRTDPEGVTLRWGSDTVLALIERVRAAEAEADPPLLKNLDRALTIMGHSIPESKEEFNLQERRYMQQLIGAVLRFSADLDEYQSERDEGRAAVAELARLREQEPVGTVKIEMDWTTHRNVATLIMREDLVVADMEDGDALYAEPRPAVLPPEMAAEPEKYDVIDHGFIAGYNQAIADARALGCQPQRFVVKLPEPAYNEDEHPWLEFDETVEAIRAAGGEVEGE